MKTNNSTKILAIAPYEFVNGKEGGKKCIDLSYKYLAKVVELHCVSTDNNKITPDLGYQFYPILGHSKFRYINPLLYFKVKKLIKTLDIDVLLTDHPYYGWLVYLLKKTTNVKLVIKSHNIEAERFKSMGKPWWKILWHYEKWISRKADLATYITDEDRLFAINNFNVSPDQTTTITYGIEQTNNPSVEQKLSARKRLVKELNLDSQLPILLFNGMFKYGPNKKALDLLIKEIIPKLRKELKFYLIICGKDIAKEYKEQTAEDIKIMGFVDDINLYFLGADIFLNPIIEGGGIKTKLVEALSFNTPAVSFENGAIGIPEAVVGENLIRVEDYNTDKFVTSIVNLSKEKNDLPNSFYLYFNWKNVIDKLVKAI